MWCAAVAGAGARTALAAARAVLQQQTRNTFVLKRRWEPPLHKKGKSRPAKMRSRHFVYDLVEDTSVARQPDLTIILKQFVDGTGHAGDVVTMRPSKAYREFLVPGLAVYATPENLEKYKTDQAVVKKEVEHSSPYVQRTTSCLSRLVLEITMNKSEPWELEPWHVRASFRKAGFVVPEHTIQMPPVKICGPDLTLQDKEFCVTVTINDKEKVNVRCRIHHWAVGLERLPWDEFHWKRPRESLLADQADVLQNMPLLN